MAQSGDDQLFNLPAQAPEEVREFLDQKHRRVSIAEGGQLMMNPGQVLTNVDSAMHLYLWRHGADRVTVPSDPHEVGTITWMPLERVDELARTGRLLGTTTALALYHYLATASQSPKRA